MIVIDLIMKPFLFRGTANNGPRDLTLTTT